MHFSLGLPRLFNSPFQAPPPTTSLFSRCASRTTRCSAHAYHALSSYRGADSHTGTLCGETIQPLSVFLPRQQALLTATTTFKNNPPPHPTHTHTIIAAAATSPHFLVHEHRKMSRKQARTGREEGKKKVVSVWPREK